MDSRPLPTIGTIAGALAGENTATETVLWHYSGYIAHYVLRYRQYMTGSGADAPDSDVRYRLEEKLVRGVRRFKILP
jgi:hypothetical protein